VWSLVSPAEEFSLGQLPQFLLVRLHVFNGEIILMPGANMFHKIAQPKVGCTSVMVDMSAEDYLNLVREIHANQGGIAGQRAVLKTKTARTIRKRMVGDISRGVSLPPLVLGILVSSDVYDEEISHVTDREGFQRFLSGVDSKSISIIDGMQRTTALFEATEGGAAGVSDVRVEFWIAEHTNNLIYRMLVLNTGQVPWDLPRQLEAIYRPLLERVDRETGGQLTFLSKDLQRRSSLGSDEYATEDIAELILIFSARKRELNVKDQVAEDFVRLDLIESTSRVDFINYFSQGLVLLTKLNSSILDGPDLPGDLTEYRRRCDSLKGFPSKAGFFSALAIHLFDKPGFETDWDSVSPKFEKIKKQLAGLVEKIENSRSLAEKEEILQLEDLEERLAKHRVGASQVGRFQREFFETAFGALFKDIDRVQNFRALWHAY